MTGSDGHSPSGVFTFGVGVTAPPPTEAVGASGTTWKDDLARWLLFAALALVIGPLVVRLVVLRGPVPVRARAAVPPRDDGRGVRGDRRRHRGVRAPRLERAAASVRGAPLRRPAAVRGEDAVRDRLPRHDGRLLRRGHASAPRLGARPARSSGGRRSRSRCCSSPGSRSPATRGPSRTRPRSRRLADWVHLVAASVWVGGVATLALLVWPLAPALQAASVPRVLADRGRAGRCARARRRISRARAPARGRRSLGDELRAAAPAEGRDRAPRARVGRVPPHFRAAAARSRGAAAGAGEPSRRDVASRSPCCSSRRC